MDSVTKCARCGAALAANAPEGLCPRCLLALNLATQTVLPEDLGPHGTRIVNPPPDDPLPLPEVAKHFPQLEILECLGRGGMGVVYKARQPLLNRLVALKILARDPQKAAAFAERFTREAQALARLNHPSIVTVHDFGETGGLYYLVMEFVDGVNLRQLLQGSQLKPQEALAIVPKICEALQYAHDQGIVHRDIKPENILVDKQGRVKIADFGLAKLLGLAPQQERLTQANQVMGTPYYMAPEQTEHPQEVDHRADIYSLGVVFYEMLTGELPLGRFAAPSEKVQVDVRLDEVVLKALAREPQRRYQQANEVKSDVETIATTPGEPAAPPVLVPSGRNAAGVRPASSRPLAYLALGLFLAGLLVTLLLLSLRPVRDEMALTFGVTAEVLALIFGMITWRERLGKLVTAATLLVLGLAGIGLLFLFLESHDFPGARSRAAALAEQRAREAAEQARLQAEQAATPAEPAKVYTQEQAQDVQPDGSIRFKSTITQQNSSGAPWRTIQFGNSDFVEVTKMTDALGREIPFDVTRRGRMNRYQATLSEPVPPGEWITYSSEGTIAGLIRPTGEPGVFDYRMRHSPGINGVTRRVETHRLPPGAQLLSSTPPDLEIRRQQDRVELFIDRRIPKGGSLEVTYRYQLQGGEVSSTVNEAVTQAVGIVSTCAEGDPRIQEALNLLKSQNEAAVVRGLAGQLDSAAPTVRRAAIYLIQNGGWKDATATAPKLTELLSHAEEYTRGMAALALGQGKVASSLESLSQMTTNDTSSYARRCAAYALGLLGDPRGEAALTRALEDANPQVKANASLALEKLRDAKTSAASASAFAAPTGAPPGQPPFNEEQRQVEAWTERQFRSFFDRRDFADWGSAEKSDLEKRLIDTLKGPQTREYFQAINTLGAMRSTNAVAPLLAIAVDRAEKNCRDRWMATRSLGLIGDTSVVPELIPLVYHGNVNTRWWGQLALVRLTGTNFGSDWKSWGRWWNGRGGQPPFREEPYVIWYGQPGWGTPEEVDAQVKEGDQRFFDDLRKPATNKTPAPSAPPAASKGSAEPRF
jgi:HEAT repeat protein/predicted Ser/Thr protein kinase